MLNPFSAMLRAKFCIDAVQNHVSDECSHARELSLEVGRPPFVLSSHLSHDRQSHQSDVCFCFHLVQSRLRFVPSSGVVHHDTSCRSNRLFPSPLETQKHVSLEGDDSIHPRNRSWVPSKTCFQSERENAKEDPGSNPSIRGRVFANRPGMSSRSKLHGTTNGCRGMLSMWTNHGWRNARSSKPRSTTLPAHARNDAHENVGREGPCSPTQLRATYHRGNEIAKATINIHFVVNNVGCMNIR